MAKVKHKHRVLTAGQARALDRKAKDKFGISTLLLMENAGRCVSEEALKTLHHLKGRVAIFCGTGNNGGDGFCAGRHLLVAGIKPDIFLTGRIRDVKNEAGVNLDILLRLKQKITQIDFGKINLLKKAVDRYSLIIDALLGVGIKGQVRAVYQDLIGVINASKAYVLSVDIPSGLDATSGKILGACIKADKTVTFVAKKRGMLSGQGKAYCGKVLVRDIGVSL